jgi:four helix bundle protein
LDIIALYDEIREKKKEFTISKQFVRSGTSIGANATEAQHAESKKDFIHKLSISQKECSETIFWLNLLKDSNYIDMGRFDSLILKAKELHKMISSAIITSKNKLSPS